MSTFYRVGGASCVWCMLVLVCTGCLEDGVGYALTHGSIHCSLEAAATAPQACPGDSRCGRVYDAVGAFDEVCIAPSSCNADETACWREDAGYGNRFECSRLDTAWDCGACDRYCEANYNAVSECAEGRCRYTCPEDTFDCDGDPSNGCLFWTAGWFGACPAVERVSIDSSGQQADRGTDASDSTRSIALSADGRVVAFSSLATNLVGGDTNGVEDVFVHDRETGSTERVSLGPDGAPFDSWTGLPSISADGRYVGFAGPGAFVRDRESGTTDLVSIAPDGSSLTVSIDGVSLDATGRLVAFANLDQAYVRDLDAGATRVVSVDANGLPGDARSFGTNLAAEGRFVVFASDARNLVDNDVNAAQDVFIYDLETGRTELVSVASDGTQADAWSQNPVVSADGNLVAFESAASNLVSVDLAGMGTQIYVRDRAAGTTRVVSIAPELGSDTPFQHSGGTLPALSSDGRYVAFQSGTRFLVWPESSNSADDIYVFDRVSGSMTEVSVTASGAEGNGHARGPAFTADGRQLAFYAESDNLVIGDTNGVGDFFVIEAQ